MRTLVLLGAVLLLVPATGPSLATALDPSDPLVEADNELEVETLARDGLGSLRAFDLHLRTSVHTPVPTIAPDTAGPLETLPRSALDADPALPLDVLLMGSFQPVKVPTIREGDTRFQLFGPGVTPGANDYRQAGSVATDAYAWGDVLEGSQVAEGEFLDRTILGTGYELSFPEQPEGPTTGSVDVLHTPIAGHVQAREFDPTTASYLDGGMAYRFDVFDVTTEGGDVLADGDTPIGSFDLEAPTPHAGSTGLITITFQPPTGTVSTDVDFQRDAKGRLAGVSLDVSLDDGTRLHESQRTPTTLEWTPRVVTVFGTYHWPNATDLAQVPAFDVMAPQPAQVRVHTPEDPTGDQLGFQASPAPRTVAFTPDGPRLEAPNPPTAPPSEGASATSVASGEAQTRGQAPGLAGLTAGDVEIGDVGLPWIIVDGEAHRVTVDDVLGEPRVQQGARGNSASLHAPFIQAGHFVDLHVFASGFGSTLFVTAIANEVRALDQQAHDVRLVWLADVDLGGEGPDELAAQDFFRQTTTPVDREGPIAQQTGQVWAHVTDPTHAPGTTLHGMVLMPNAVNADPTAGAHAQFVAIEDPGHLTSDPLLETVPPAELSDGFDLYAETAYHGAFTPSRHWLTFQASG